MGICVINQEQAVLLLKERHTYFGGLLGLLHLLATDDDLPHALVEPTAMADLLARVVEKWYLLTEEPLSFLRIAKAGEELRWLQCYSEFNLSTGLLNAAGFKLSSEREASQLLEQLDVALEPISWREEENCVA